LKYVKRIVMADIQLQCLAMGIRTEAETVEDLKLNVR